ncbi:hypothetical protein BDV95DRAFT_528151 [Massariosphaeria phaeospora]|uniref:Ankyrin repeat protein n=1 Tax=Massariosphaeria phaeospora TaxID=100035 RepID=A0A7C8I8M7_9PLEO|nr:hypothetical protein BDV95DRAFT_528151 [Massariosphaeria phaeospora]
MANQSSLPDVPATHAQFISFVHSNQDRPIRELIGPYKQYDAKLREIFAQEPEHPILADEHLNVVPVFDGNEQHVKTRARNLDTESDEDKERYIMPLDSSHRHADGSPAIVPSIKDFQHNFAVFCESSLVDLDWTNVVAAGSSVVTSLLPVPPKYGKSKKALRQYYHEIVAPASDVDLFLYGVNEEEAVKKIIEIEQRIKDSILTETTTIRTKNAITIVSQYPTRHIQIVLRIYKSVSEILTGFDVDCSCAAYDGKQVWASPRALGAYMTQTNTIDLTRRSPSYENRLSKYSHRGFEVYWPQLERSRIDPTIFERNFARTVGLARLLVLERLPSKTEREAYMDERRRERNRPAINRHRNFSLHGNIKDGHEDEVAEWVEQDDVSDYHTFTIPYGPKHHAKKIEKLMYTKDLLLNAEWNKRDDREVNLHRHPAFFGYAEDVIHDCCGFCPKPITPEEEEIAEQEAKIYVSGGITFVRDNPGRQSIGSFHPITDTDWTEMSYVGNTARLCQAIVDQDVEHVEDWLSQEGSDPNCRDYTGRTPLHLAVTCSSASVVRALINHSARLVARVADGRTALHMAAIRGNVEILKMLLEKSEENEEEEAKKEEAKKKERRRQTDPAVEEGQPGDTDRKEQSGTADEEDVEMVDMDGSEDENYSTTTGSYVKVKEQAKKIGEDSVPDEEDEPDVYDINVLAWDSQCSPLHLAILAGHVDVVKKLVQTFGADVLLPIKLLNDHDKSPRGAILTMVLALRLPLEQSKAMIRVLLDLGASSAQADMGQITALHSIAIHRPELLETLFEIDEPAAKRAVNHFVATRYSPVESPLMSAITEGNALAATKLLDAGAEHTIQFNDWTKAMANRAEITGDYKQNHNRYLMGVEQPIVLAVQAEMPKIALRLLAQGASPDTLDKSTQSGVVNDYWHNRSTTRSLLDLVRENVKTLREYEDEAPTAPRIIAKKDDDAYLEGIAPGSYKYFVARRQIRDARAVDERNKQDYEKRLQEHHERKGVEEKKEAISTLAAQFEEVELELVNKGAKTFKELYPDVEKPDHDDNYAFYLRSPNTFKSLSILFDFSVLDLTDETREAYLDLFQAAWDGDLQTIQSLTLAPWGPLKDRTPLQVAIQDESHQSPFSIAVLRGHFDLARALVEISHVQYHPDEEQPKTRYYMGNKDDGYSDDESDSSDIPIRKETIDAKFTFDVGEVSTKVKSKVTPLNFMSWAYSAWSYAEYVTEDVNFTSGVDDRAIQNRGLVDLTAWATITNDKKLFSFLLDLDVEWTDRLANQVDGSSGIPSFSESDFQLAVKHGRLDILADMIKHAGAGMDLESLVKESGVKIQEKPKYYQGLSVHGRKRTDWVAAARGTYVGSVTDVTPPLLHAAFGGSLASVEWFLSDAPTRHYLDFAEAYKHNKLIKHLNTAAGGFEKVLRKWLGARHELALHSAIMAEPTTESNKIIEYLLKAIPQSLEFKTSAGLTPLALAFSLRRLDAAKLLLTAGADQTVRAADGSNILHLLLCSYNGTYCNDNEQLTDFLYLIDPRLKASLLGQCNTCQPGSLTPIARWLRQYQSTDGAPDVLRSLLDFGSVINNEHLEQLDGSGQTPLHSIVTSRKLTSLNLILEYRPDLLYCENAVGQTPYEVAQDLHINVCASATLSVPRHNTNSIPGNNAKSITTQPPQAFVDGYVERKLRQDREPVWRICEQLLAEHPGKRKLVSLLDANEVAKRLAMRKTSQRRSRLNETASDNGDDGDDEEKNQEGASTKDEVAQWYDTAASYGRGMPTHALHNYQQQLYGLEGFNQQRLLFAREYNYSHKMWGQEW